MMIFKYLSITLTVFHFKFFFLIIRDFWWPFTILENLLAFIQKSIFNFVRIFVSKNTEASLLLLNTARFIVLEKIEKLLSKFGLIAHSNKWNSILLLKLKGVFGRIGIKIEIIYPKKLICIYLAIEKNIFNFEFSIRYHFYT